MPHYKRKKLTQTIAGGPEGQRDPEHRWVVPAQSASNRRPLSPAHPTLTTARGLPRSNPPPGRDPRGRTAALGPLAEQADTAASLETPGSDHPLPAPNSSPPQHSQNSTTTPDFPTHSAPLPTKQTHAQTHTPMSCSRSSKP
jgi:hypothetical protein